MWCVLCVVVFMFDDDVCVCESLSVVLDVFRFVDVLCLFCVVDDLNVVVCVDVENL